MKDIFLKRKKTFLSLFLALTLILFLIKKIGFLGSVKPLEMKLFYLPFFGTIFGLVILWWKKNISTKDFLIITFPSALILFFATDKNNILHYFFNILVGVWLILAGIFAVRKISKKKYKIDSLENFSSEEKNREETKINLIKRLFSKINLVFLIIIIASQLFFALYHANKALYVDEKLWTYGGEMRIQKYWINIFTRDWYSTRPSDKPGVTLALISGLGLKWTDPYSFLRVKKDFPDLEGRKKFANMLFIMRIPTIIFISFSLIIFYFFISNLFDEKFGLISTAFISLSSLLIGISRLINPDALTWIFIPLTFFTYFVYQKKQEKVYLYSTGFFLGLSLLTKYISNLLFPFFLVEIFAQAILLKIDKKDLPQFFKKKFLDFIVIVILSLITFYILYPGVWVKLDRLFIGTLGSQAFEPIWKPFVAFILLFVLDIFILKSRIFTYIIERLKKIRGFILILIPTIFVIAIFLVLVNVYSKMHFVNFEDLMVSPKTAGRNSSYLSVFLSGFYGLIFGITPLVLFGLLINLFFNIKYFVKKETARINFKNYFIWQVLFFVLIYFLASTFSKVVPIARYQITIYPLVIMLGCLGFYALWERFKMNKKIFFGFLILGISLNILTLWSIKPFYFSYNSSLLPQDYLINPKDTGEGNYEAAEYLNSLENPEKLVVWADKNGVCDFFVGKCVTSTRQSSFESYDFNFDYFVISRGRENMISQSAKRGDYQDRFILYKLYNGTFDDKIVHEIKPANRDSNYIRIISGKDINIIPKKQ